MSTRSGARYHPKNLESNHKMNFDFAAAFKDITERLNAIGGLVQDLNMRNWDLLLCRAEFAYNSFINRTIGMSAFEIVYGHHLKKLVDLIPVPLHTRTSEIAESFTQHIRNLSQRNYREN